MIRLGLVLLLVFAGPARAEVIRVQSGDHAGFTRLVLAIPASRDWRFGRQGDGYSIETGVPTDSFDVSSVFDLIGRDRLSGLTTGNHPDRLDLTLTCDCHATAIRWQTDWVIVDIIDGAAPAGSPFEVPLAADVMSDPTNTVMPTATLDADTITQPIGMMSNFSLSAGAPTSQSATTTLILPLVMDGHSNVILPATLPVFPPEMSATTPVEPTGLEQIGPTEQAIIESFARAASQGLLDIVPAPEPMAEQDSDPSHDADGNIAEMHPLGPQLDTGMHPIDVATSPLAEYGLRFVDPNQPGLTSHTSVDRNELPIGPPDAYTQAGGRCLDDSLFDMEGWGDDRDFSTQIGERLSALTTEFDVYPVGAVEALAQSYLYFGFGREALQALDIDETDSQQRRVMAAMAHVADEEPDPSGLFSSQLGCATQSAIWTALSRGTLAGTTEAERSAATEGFRALPPMLRGHLGVHLAEIFVNFGDPDTAQSVLEAAREHVTADRPETAMAAAEIALVAEGPQAAIPALGDIAAVDIRLTPEALVQLINLTLDDGQLIDPSLVSLADSMMYEHRGQPVAAELIAAQARALTAYGAFDQAFLLLAGDVAPMDVVQLAALRSAAILSLAAKADDAAFLNFAFDALPETGNPAVENAVASRLLALGFADRAAAILTSPATGSDARDRRYIQADIALALGDYSAVNGFLAGLSDPRATEITARALAAQGDFAAASSAQTILPGTAPDPAEAWRAGEWSVLEQSGDPLLQAASGAVLAPPETLDPAAPLAASRALLEQATATQDLAGQLLDRFAIEPAATLPPAN